MNRNTLVLCYNPLQLRTNRSDNKTIKHENKTFLNLKILINRFYDLGLNLKILIKRLVTTCG